MEEMEEMEEGEDQGAGRSSDSPAEGQEEQDDDPLQLAWEVLDVARSLYEKMDGQELKLADTYASLGDINLRNDQYDAALNDYGLCLEIRERHCCSDDRLLLECNHQLAMTHINHPTPDKQASLRFYKQAVKICETRVANLKKLLKMDGMGEKIPGSSVEPQSKALTEVELNEIEEIAEDLKGRIEAEEVADESAAGSSSSAAAASSSGSAFGADAVKALAAQAGLSSSGFAAMPEDAGPVKKLGVFGKKKKEPATEAPAAEAKEADKPAEAKGTEEGAGSKRPAEEEAPSTEPKKTKMVESDASAAPTPAREATAA